MARRRKNCHKKRPALGTRVSSRVSREETGIYFEMEDVVYWDVLDDRGNTIMRIADYEPFDMVVRLADDRRHVIVTQGDKEERVEIHRTFDPEGHYEQGASARDWNRKD